LVLGNDGQLYGVTLEGAGEGTIYKITINGEFTLLRALCSDGFPCADGSGPRGLTLGRDGNFYGVTQEAGANDDGTVFKITPDGQYTVLHDFASSEGEFPAPLTQARDGNFYGTATIGGAHNAGTIYKVSPTGRFRVIHDFCGQPNCTDGNDGLGVSLRLVEGLDGSLYGFTGLGGTKNLGVIFKTTPQGAFSVLYNFCSQSKCADGKTPQALLRGSDGNFYGTTVQGGTGKCFGGCGVYFRITPDGVFTVLHDFQAAEGMAPCCLSRAGDQNFFGVSVNSAGEGTLLKLTPSGTITLILTGPSGGFGEVTQANDGNLYGALLLGGVNFDDGAIFSIKKNSGSGH
jgi:uncharacterized repeat protein (TIGR03803 family)